MHQQPPFYKMESVYVQNVEVEGGQPFVYVGMMFAVMVFVVQSFLLYYFWVVSCNAATFGLTNTCNK